MKVTDYLPYFDFLNYDCPSNLIGICIDGNTVSLTELFEKYSNSELDEVAVALLDQTDRFAIQYWMKQASNQAFIIDTLKDALDHYIEEGGDPLHWIYDLLSDLQINYDNYPTAYRPAIQTSLIQWSEFYKNFKADEPDYSDTDSLTAKEAYRSVLCELFAEAKANDYIHKNTRETDFISIWGENRDTRIKWIGSKKSCVGFMTEVTAEKVNRTIINRYFDQHGTNTKTGARVDVKLKPGDMSNPTIPQFLNKFRKGK